MLLTYILSVVVKNGPFKNSFLPLPSEKLLISRGLWIPNSGQLFAALLRKLRSVSFLSLSFSLSNGAEENAAAYCWSTIITKRNIIRLPNSFFSGVFGLLLVLSLRFVYKNIYSMYTISFFFLLFRVRKRAAATQW